jgi:DNA-binding LacI/PurR family transcriptional regulator
VMSDNYSGGMAATRELLDHGHRRVAFIGDLIAKTVQDRLLGMRDAMGDAGLAFDRSLVVDLKRGHERMGDWSTCIEDAARDLMNGPNPPTAIFCSCDAVARSVYRSVGAMGLQIPKDVSVIGFDDDPLAEWLTPALSTVRQPFERMGAISLETLCKRMDDPSASCDQHVLPVELVKRQSVANPAR